MMRRVYGRHARRGWGETAFKVIFLKQRANERHPYVTVKCQFKSVNTPADLRLGLRGVIVT